MKQAGLLAGGNTVGDDWATSNFDDRAIAHPCPTPLLVGVQKSVKSADFFDTINVSLLGSNEVVIVELNF